MTLSHDVLRLTRIPTTIAEIVTLPAQNLEADAGGEGCGGGSDVVGRGVVSRLNWMHVHPDGTRHDHPFSGGGHSHQGRSLAAVKLAGELEATVRTAAEFEEDDLPEYADDEYNGRIPGR